MSYKYTTRYLERKEFDIWNSFVDECEDGTIFNKSFWLENIYKYQKNVVFRIVGCFDKDSNLTGGIALGFKKKFSIFSIIVPPVLTPYSGVLIKPRSSKYKSKIENYHLKILEEIIIFIDQDYSFVTFTLNPKFKDLRMFSWNNYKVDTKYTYLSQLNDINALLESFDPDVKRQIKKLGKNYSINFNDSVETFYQLQGKSFSRQKHTFKLSFNKFKDFLNGLDKHLYKVYSIYNLDKPVYSTIVLFHKQTGFYWLAGGDPEYFTKGYNKALLYEIILDLYNHQIKNFDFIGANTPSISKYKSNFGFDLTPYFCVEKTNNRTIKFLLTIKSFLNRKY